MSAPDWRLRLRVALNRCRRWVWHCVAHRVVFGERSADGRWLRHTRIAPSTCIEGVAGLQLADHVFIGAFNLLDAGGGLVIDEGVQITNFVSVLTHSTHRSVRLLGAASAVTGGARVGDVRGPVQIGAYSFIGPHSVIEAGTRIGRGTLVCAYSRLRGDYPDFAVLDGNPARVVGDTRQRDAGWLIRHPELLPAYQAWAGPVGEDLQPPFEERPDD